MTKERRKEEKKLKIWFNTNFNCQKIIYNFEERPSLTEKS